MKAIRIREPGGPDVLELTEMPSPELGASSVRVRVHAVGINRADILQRMGMYPAPEGTIQDVPGLEYAGEVIECGATVTSRLVGERVYGLVPGGAYADEVVVHEREAVPIPTGLSFTQAAAIPEAFITAYDALAIRGRLLVGERVLIHAVGSGVGTAGLQIAKQLGCSVAGTSRTPSKLARARELGLDHGVVAQAPDSWIDEVRASLGQPDVVLELCGGGYVPADIEACALKARIVVVGLTAGIACDLPLAKLLKKRVELIGTVLRSRPLEERIAAAQVLAGPLRSWLDAGALEPIVHAEMPWENVGEAHELMTNNAGFGKIVLTVNS